MRVAVVSFLQQRTYSIATHFESWRLAHDCNGPNHQMMCTANDSKSQFDNFNKAAGDFSTLAQRKHNALRGTMTICLLSSEIAHTKNTPMSTAAMELI